MCTVWLIKKMEEELRRSWSGIFGYFCNERYHNVHLLESSLRSNTLRAVLSTLLQPLSEWVLYQCFITWIWRDLRNYHPQSRCYWLIPVDFFLIANLYKDYHRYWVKRQEKRALSTPFSTRTSLSPQDKKQTEPPVNSQLALRNTYGTWWSVVFLTENVFLMYLCTLICAF